MKSTAHAPALCARFHHASELIGRRWTGAIIFLLLQQTCRFATLRDAIPDITDRMLSERLQELEQEGVVERMVVPETPVRVEVLVDEEREGPGRGGQLAGGVGREARPARTARPHAGQKNGPLRKRLRKSSRYYRCMPFSAHRYAAATALLLLFASMADAQPTTVSPFPRDLSGTLAFQSDVRTTANPNGRVKLYTIDLASGRVSALTRDGDWHDEQPRWSPDGRRIAFRSTRGGSHNLYLMDADGSNVTAPHQSRRQRLRPVVAAGR